MATLGNWRVHNKGLYGGKKMRKRVRRQAEARHGGTHSNPSSQGWCGSRIMSSRTAWAT
jgi:hypothetical protein